MILDINCVVYILSDFVAKRDSHISDSSRRIETWPCASPKVTKRFKSPQRSLLIKVILFVRQEVTRTIIMAPCLVMVLERGAFFTVGNHRERDLVVASLYGFLTLSLCLSTCWYLVLWLYHLMTPSLSTWGTQDPRHSETYNTLSLLRTNAWACTHFKFF